MVSEQNLRDRLQNGPMPVTNMFPGPTELRLIGYSIESTWTQKSKSSTSIPKTNLPTFSPR